MLSDHLGSFAKHSNFFTNFSDTYGIIFEAITQTLIFRFENLRLIWLQKLGNTTMIILEFNRMTDDDQPTVMKMTHASVSGTEVLEKALLWRTLPFRHHATFFMLSIKSGTHWWPDHATCDRSNWLLCACYWMVYAGFKAFRLLWKRYIVVWYNFCDVRKLALIFHFKS